MTNNGVPVEKLIEMIGRQTITIQILNEQQESLIQENTSLKQAIQSKNDNIVTKED